MTLFLVGIALTLAGGMSTVVTRRSRRATSDAVYQSLVVAGCVAGSIAAARVLIGGATVSIAIPAAMPVGGRTWVLGIDALSAVFLLAIFPVSAACAVFGTQDLAR